jgi:hypothetical protein
VQLCEVEVGAGCGDQQRCVKRPAQEFEQEVCIRQVGDVSCPPGWFDRDVTIYGSGTDTRTCEGCACDLSAVGCQGGKHTVSKGSGCLPPPGNGNELTIDSTACTQAGGFAQQANGIISSKATPATPVGEQCGSVVASGEVIVGESEKVCCRSVGP